MGGGAITQVMRKALVWLRRDLRTSDNRAIQSALDQTEQVHVGFVFDTDILDLSPRNDRRVEFIHGAVTAVDEQLRKRGGGLHVMHGMGAQQIVKLAKQLNVDVVVAAEDYEPAAIARDKQVRDDLAQAGCCLELVQDHVIYAKTQLLTGGGKPYTVFTPYKKKWLANFDLDRFRPATTRGWSRLAVENVPKIPSLKNIGFEPTNLVALKIEPNENGAKKLLRNFSSRIDRYEEQRNFPAVKGPSYLSVHLRFGTISIRQAVVQACQSMDGQADSKGAATWLSELIWRDFYFQILSNFPHVVGASFKSAYDRIRWDQSEALFQAWCDGKTGYPLVDAAMAQINQTGYMHNRLRMVVASFLCKDLGISWQRGEAYFAEQLIDFDMSANNGGWQWASSSGCDAQPYFRIFNPITQSQRFDPKGAFIRRYLPVLSKLSDKSIHAPWQAPPLELQAAEVALGHSYPLPVVDHALARQETLARYAVVKG